MRRFLSGSAAFAMLAIGVATAGVANAQDNSTSTEATPLVSSTVVINEVSTRGPNGQLDEFIEIRNVANRPINLSGHQIRIYSANSQVGVISVPAGTVLQPRGNVGQFLVLTGQDFSGTIADESNVLPMFLVGAEGIPSNGGVAIFNGTGAKLDGVAFSLTVPAAREGQPAVPETVVTEQLEAANARDILSTDTDSNRVDFALHVRTPGALN
ncbi:Lamin Tail Domain [Amycolatopsis xylanica]|uniref:Lamin Tail Domain n=1 Tax=Amycolatopsis xylanica TaxID=589385 RepID=A0A1H3R4D7_9PSEU|nr:lamin tail domain-containing protein [Amycolatopsis xylanica]SDZ20557.1 Lamin Tail Domain [Amycolatopsis xylanica]